MKSEKKELKAFSLEPGPCTKDQEMKGITYSGPGEGRDYIFRWQGFGKKERNLLVWAEVFDVLWYIADNSG